MLQAVWISNVIPSQANSYPGGSAGAIGKEHIVGEMGKYGTARFQRCCRCNGLFDVEMERMRIPAQTVDHQHIQPLQQCQR